MSDFLTPPTSLLCKLASVAVHAEEFLSPDGHAFDEQALSDVLADTEVREWIEQMTKAALAPRKRLP